MKNLITTLTTAALIVGGCAANVPEKQTGGFPEGHIIGYDFAEKTHSDTPYKLERVVIHGKQFYSQEADSTEKREGALPFVFVPFDKATREIDLDSGKMRLIAGEKYMPVRVELDKDTEDRWADQVQLSRTGPRRVKANVLRRKNEGDRYGSSFVTTENNAPYNIRTIEILGEKYFFPHTGRKSSEKELSFYLIPVEGAKLRIRNSDGSITIRNEDQVYIPVSVESLPEVEAKAGKSPGEAERVGSSEKEESEDKDN